MGCVEFNLCDTTGMANPRQVAEVASYFVTHFAEANIVMHFHNTRGIGAANVLSAIQNGITSIETSFGGLGGCPFAPGASGNVCTEDVVHMLHEMGIATGVQLPILIEKVREIENLLGLQFPGQVIKAGERGELHPLPVD
jgi:hydroxymethylglutaryl-CoA lyase